MQKLLLALVAGGLLLGCTVAVEEDLGSGDGPSTTTSSRTYRTTTAAPTPAVWTCESELQPCYAHQICEDKPAVDCTDKESYPDGAKCHDFVCIPDPHTEAPDTVGKVDKPVSVERTVLLPGMTENKFWQKELDFKNCVGELDRSSSSSSNGDGGTMNKVEVDDLILRDNADLEVRFTVLVAASTQQAVARDLGGPVFLRNLETSLGLSRPPYLVNPPPTLGTTTTITTTTTPSAVAADASTTTTTNPKAASGGNAAGGLAPGAAAAVAVIVLIVLVGLPVGRHYYRRQRTGRLQVYGRLDNSGEHRNLAFVDDNTAFGTTAAAAATEMGNAGAAAALYEDL